MSENGDDRQRLGTVSMSEFPSLRTLNYVFYATTGNRTKADRLCRLLLSKTVRESIVLRRCQNIFSFVAKQSAVPLMIIEDYVNNSNDDIQCRFKLWSIIRILVARMKHPPRNQITFARIFLVTHLE